jgi:hypothetical protein
MITMDTLSPIHKSDYSLTSLLIVILPNPAWADPKKTVSFDPWGHVVPDEIEHLGLDIRPSIAMSELGEAARQGTIKIDGSMVSGSQPLKNIDGTRSDPEPGVEVNVGKAAVEPVWYLPGVAEKFGM